MPPSTSATAPVTMQLRDAAKQFVANLRPGDRMEIGAFHNTIRWVRPFTGSQQTLNRALDLFTPKMVDFGTALWPAMCEGLKEFYGVEGRKGLRCSRTARTTTAPSRTA